MEEWARLFAGDAERPVFPLQNSDRPSGPSPTVTPSAGFFRPGLVYVDDSATARQSIRRALYPHGLLVETFDSPEAMRGRPAHLTLIAALLDVDLGDGASGLDVAREIIARHPDARIAFFTAEASAERLANLHSHGTVFDKVKDIDKAIQWLVEAATAGEEKAGESR